MTLETGSQNEFLARPLRETSVEALAELFTSGAKPRDRWMIGLEIELLPFLQANDGPVEHPTLARVLDHLISDRSLSPEHESSGLLVGAKGNGIVISLEPGGQIEYASRPYRKLKDLRLELETFSDAMKASGAREGVGFWAMGHQPYVDRNTAAKMPKARYDLMRRYMPTRGTRGLDMMHLTGSVQCAVDYSDEESMTNKVRTAARATPFFSALTASAPFVGGRIGEHVSERYEIWRDTDNTRSGLWPEMLDERGLTFVRYVERALSTPAMFFLRDDAYRMPEARPFAHFAQHGFEGTVVTVSDFIDHLTSLFPEIRIKSYIELRGADCAPPREATAIAAFWRGLLDIEASRLEADERISALSFADVVTLQAEVARVGLEAVSPIGSARRVVKELVDLAYRGLSQAAPDCAECMLPLVERAERGQSLADEMIERARSSSIAEALRLVEI